MFLFFCAIFDSIVFLFRVLFHLNVFIKNNFVYCIRIWIWIYIVIRTFMFWRIYISGVWLTHSVHNRRRSYRSTVPLDVWRLSFFHGRFDFLTVRVDPMWRLFAVILAWKCAHSARPWTPVDDDVAVRIYLLRGLDDLNFEPVLNLAKFCSVWRMLDVERISESLLYTVISICKT